MVRTRWVRGRKTLGLLSSLLAGAGTAAAQTSPLPTRQEVTPPTPDRQAESSASVDSRAALSRSACPFETSPLRLTLNTVRFTRPDGGALPPEIAELLAPLGASGGEQSIRVVCDLRDRANAALQRAGYVASVQIPAQEIAGGELVLQVITARIVEVRVRGNAGPYQKLLRDRIERIKALNPLNERVAERLLLLAGDTPGLQVQLSLRPAGAEPGAVIGELTVAFRRYSVLANTQTYNSRSLGRESLYARGEIYGLTGLSDLTYVGASASYDFHKQVIAQAGHVAGLDANGTTLGARITYAWSRPDLGALDYRTDTLIAGIDLQRPLFRSLNENVRARAGFDFVNQLSTVGASGVTAPLTTDKLRVFFLGIDGDYRRPRSGGGTAFAVNASLELRKGTGVFGASKVGFANGVLTSRIDGDPRALVVRGSVDATVGLGRVFSLAGGVQGQWADRALLNYEELSIGNLTVGRGYDPGAASGDRVVGGHGELRADVPVTRLFGTQLFGFYDRVFVNNLDRNLVENNRTYRSFGGGARFALPGRLVLEALYAHPQDKVSILDQRRPSDRVLVSLTAQLRGPAR